MNADKRMLIVDKHAPSIAILRRPKISFNKLLTGAKKYWTPTLRLPIQA